MSVLVFFNVSFKKAVKVVYNILFAFCMEGQELFRLNDGGHILAFHYLVILKFGYSPLITSIAEGNLQILCFTRLLLRLTFFVVLEYQYFLYFTIQYTLCDQVFQPCVGGECKETFKKSTTYIMLLRECTIRIYSK